MYSTRIHIVIILTNISCFYMNISAFYIKFRTEMLKTVCEFWKNKVVQYIQNYTKKISKTNKIINKVFQNSKKY